MGFKRRKGDGDGEEMEAGDNRRASFNTTERRNMILPSMIKNKYKRAKVYAKQKHEIKARNPAEKLALELGEELFADIDADEFNPVLRREVTPKVLITTCRFNSTRGPAFISELQSVIPNSDYRKRGTYVLKKIVEYAKKKGYTSLTIVHTNRRETG